MKVRTSAMMPAPPEGSKPAIVSVTGGVTLFTCLKHSQPPREIFEDSFRSASPNRPTLIAKVLSLLCDSAGKFWIQATVIFDDSPVRRHALPAIQTVLF